MLGATVDGLVVVLLPEAPFRHCNNHWLGLLLDDFLFFIRTPRQPLWSHAHQRVVWVGNARRPNAIEELVAWLHWRRRRVLRQARGLNRMGEGPLGPEAALPAE